MNRHGASSPKKGGAIISPPAPSLKTNPKNPPIPPLAKGDKGGFDSLTDLDLFAITLYGEARGEGLEGLCAVGSVIMNRVKNCQISSNKAGKMSTMQAVILKPKQFSCFNPDDQQYSKLHSIAQNFKSELKVSMNLRQCYWIAKGLLEKYLLSNVDNAEYYHTKTCDPKWDDKMLLVKIIGNHQFYVEKKTQMTTEEERRNSQMNKTQMNADKDKPIIPPFPPLAKGGMGGFDNKSKILMFKEWSESRQGSICLIESGSEIKLFSDGIDEIKCFPYAAKPECIECYKNYRDECLKEIAADGS